MEIKNVAIIGAGTMGPAIAQNFAINDIKTTIFTRAAKTADAVEKEVKSSILSMRKNDFISEKQLTSAEKNLFFSTDMDDFADADLVIEAVTEKSEIKAEVFEKLDSICRKDAILASSTSALNIYSFVNVSNPQRLAIVHFNNPANILPVVEIVRGPETSDETVSTLRNLLNSIGKMPIVLKRYIPGFICNRLNIALLRECCYMVEQGWISPEDIDLAYVGNQGIKAPFEGPLEMMDYIGWDVVSAVCQMVYPSISSSTEPNKLAISLIENGTLGVKSGKGLYDYSEKPREKIVEERNQRAIEVAKLSRILLAKRKQE